jgi:hypothetical protein
MGYRDEEAALAVRRQDLEQRAADLETEIASVQQLLRERNERLRGAGFDEIVVRVPRLERPLRPSEGAPAARLRAYVTELEKTLAASQRVHDDLRQALASPERRGAAGRLKHFVGTLSVRAILARHYGKLLVVALAGVAYWGCSPTLVGRRFASRWAGGPTPYRCGPNDDLWGSRIDGLRVEAKSGIAVQTDGCVMKLTNPHLRGPVALNVGGGSRLTIIGGEIDGCVAIRAHGHSTISLVDVKVTGRFELDDGATVTGGSASPGRVFDGAPCSALAPIRTDDFATNACDGVTECYRKNGALGSIHGELRVTLGEGGVAKTPSFEGEASPPVRACLEALALTRRVDPAYDAGGTLTCFYAGTVGPGGTERMDLRPTFMP